MRKVCYVSGTRADFGLMASTLTMLNDHPKVDLSICVTGMHLSAKYGYTIDEIAGQGFKICGRIPVEMEETSLKNMGKAIGIEIIGMIDVFAVEQPDIVLLLGDRGEMLAGAIAALHLNIPIIHIHGGVRSGTVDEPVRHAISKLSHYHFVGTEESRLRLIKMGEYPENVFNTGTPSLDDIVRLTPTSKKALCEEVGFDSTRPIGVLVFHPIVQEINSLGDQMRQVMSGALDASLQLQLVCLTANADAGGDLINQVLTEYRDRADVRIITHMSRHKYLSWLAAADVMIGNSSSGIVEATSLKLMSVNIGSRQNMRERNENVIDVGLAPSAITDAIQRALVIGKRDWHNVYGDGQSDVRITELVVTLPLTEDLLAKSNSY